ncbi:MAG: hypothetical protein QXM22_01560 [Candidatus Bathyarchaeia archaeon]
MNDKKEKKKTNLWTKLTTEDWMTKRQLKVYMAIEIIIIAILDYMVFISALAVFNSTLISAVFGITIFILAVSLVVYRIRAQLRKRD